MSNVAIGIIGVLVLFVLLASRMWAGVAMALVGFFGVWIIQGLPQALNVVGSVPFSTINNVNLTVVPMFIFMGMIISETSIGKGLFGVANATVGRFRGGLAMASVIAAGFLGAITGTIMAGSIIMAKIALPEMKKYHYDDAFSAASIAGGAPLSIIIPPSVTMCIYGLVADASIGTLFIGGFIPGFILVLIYVFTIAVMTRMNSKLGPAGGKSTWKEFWHSLKGVLPMLILFIMIFGGIYGGVCTTTEAGAIGSLGAILIAIITRDFNGKKFIKCVVETVKMTGAVFLLLIGSYILISFMSVSKLPYALTRVITNSNMSLGIFLILVCILYIILGMFLPDMAIIALSVPLLLPVVQQVYGMSTIWFGIFVTFMAALGGLTPPVGLTVYLIGGLSKVPVMKIFKQAIPYMLGILVVVAIICFIPEIVMFLPNLMH